MLAYFAGTNTAVTSISISIVFVGQLQMQKRIHCKYAYVLVSLGAALGEMQIADIGDVHDLLDHILERGPLGGEEALDLG